MSVAKQHLSEARDSLSQLTSLPEASKLQGDTRTQVSQVISNFNELITAQSNWHASYEKLDASLTSLLGPEDQPSAPPATGVTGATGTSGTTPAASQLDPAIRGKLVEFRTHLKEFEKAAGSSSATTSTQPAPDAMPPSAATSTTANPANPATPTPTGTTGSTPPAAATSAEPTTSAAQAPAAAASHADADKELDAISEILTQSKSGALTKAQTTELRKHVETLRALINQGK
jgi:hypothetical protein